MNMGTRQKYPRTGKPLSLMNEGNDNANRIAEQDRRNSGLLFSKRPDTVLKFLSRSKYGGSVNLYRDTLSSLWIVSFFSSPSGSYLEGAEAA